MKNCPQCGFHHIDLDERCIRCGAKLDSLSAPKLDDDLEERLREKIKFTGGELPGRNWSLPSRILAALRRWRYFTGRALASELPRDVHERNPWISGFFSIIPGLGQFYNHQPKKGMLIALFIAISTTVAVLTIKNPYSNYILLIPFLAEVYSFHDAFITAKLINRDYFIWQHGVAFFVAWILYIAGSCIAFQYASAHFLCQFRDISYNVLSPFLRQGDRVLVMMPGRPKVGDIVLYHPRAVTIEVTADETAAIDLPIYIIHPTSMIERVVAEPGQTFERRGGVFYRDNKPVPINEEPMIPQYLPNDFKLTAPPGDYLVMFSYTFGRDYLYALNPSIGTVDAPKLNDNQTGELHQIVHNWFEVSVVHPNEITGRVVLIYNPPEHRKMMH